MQKTDIEKYIKLMDEVKARLNVIYSFQNNNIIDEAASIESICLQLRKILELIALSSLVANKKKYTETLTNIEKHWNAKLILKEIRRINPSFYPQSYSSSIGIVTGTNFHLEKNIKDYLTEKDFLKTYEKCGAMMHSRNPFGSKIDYQYYKKNITLWCTKIKNLLGLHLITLVDNPIIYLIDMQFDTTNKTHCHICEPVDNP